MPRKTTKNATKLNAIASQFRQIEENQTAVFKAITKKMCPSDFGLDDTFMGTECGRSKDYDKCEVCWHRSFINCGRRRISREAWK